MSVEISTAIIHASFASVINEVQPKANIYDNPNQQGTVYPAWFIVHRTPVEVQKDLGKRRAGNRYLLIFQIDIWYMLQQNITRLYDQYSQMAEALEYHLQYLPIYGSDAVVQVYDRSWSMELNALKYSTTLKLRVYTDESEKFVFTPMEVITNVGPFLKNQNESFITFNNTAHPEFDVEFPRSISVTTGKNANLPVVTGTFEDELYIWTPKQWSIGTFGSLIQVNENITTELEWEGEEKPIEFPDVSFGGYFGDENWCYCNNGEARTLDVPPDAAVMYYGDPLQQTLTNPAYRFSILEWQSEEGVTAGHGEIGWNIYVPAVPMSLIIKNLTEESVQFYRIRVAVCHSDLVVLERVFDIETDKPFHAFKYVVGAKDFYYVLDGINNDWTDDIEAIGYKLSEEEDGE